MPSLRVRIFLRGAGCCPHLRTTLRSQGGPQTSPECFPQILPSPDPAKGEVPAAEAGFSSARAHRAPCCGACARPQPFPSTPSSVLGFEPEEFQSEDDAVLNAGQGLQGAAALSEEVVPRAGGGTLPSRVFVDGC